MAVGVSTGSTGVGDVVGDATGLAIRGLSSGPADAGECTTATPTPYAVPATSSVPATKVAKTRTRERAWVMAMPLSVGRNGAGRWTVGGRARRHSS